MYFVEGREVEAKTEADTSRVSAALGSLEVTLLADQKGSSFRTTTRLRDATPTLAREVPIVLSALLFAERQMRATGDPSRMVAVDDIVAACRASREGLLRSSSAPAATRTVATYLVRLFAGQGFRTDVDAKVDGVPADIAGRQVVGALTQELLATLAEPYRTFYREMLEAVVNNWRDRRPSLIESTWVWSVALRRLDQLTKSGVAIVGDPQSCEACGAVRPSGYACLRCGATPAAPRLDDLIASVSNGATEPLEPSRASPPSLDVASPAPQTLPSSSSSSSAVATAPTPSILPAKELAMELDEVELPPPALAGPGRRALALLLDLASGLILGIVGGFGVTNILVSNGAFGPNDSPASVAVTILVLVLGLYLIVGWAKGETLGMAVCRIHLVRAVDQHPTGLGRALLRALGYFGLILLAFAVFYILNEIDNQLVFIQGTADTVVRIIIGIITLYILWVGSGQPILTRSGRQSWGDQLAKVLVTMK